MTQCFKGQEHVESHDHGTYEKKLSIEMMEKREKAYRSICVFENTFILKCVQCRF